MLCCAVLGGSCDVDRERWSNSTETWSVVNDAACTWRTSDAVHHSPDVSFHVGDQAHGHRSPCTCTTLLIVLQCAVIVTLLLGRLLIKPVSVSARAYIRPSTNSSKGHRGPKAAKMADFKDYLLRRYACNQKTNGEWYSETMSKFCRRYSFSFGFTWPSKLACYEQLLLCSLGFVMLVF